MSARWKVCDVADMRGPREQFMHVAKHLYNPAEIWEQVVPGLGDPRVRAWEVGCLRVELSSPRPDCYRVSDACREHVLRDHDERLAPAYRAALAESERSERYGRNVGDRTGWTFVGDRGVTVIVREAGRPRRPGVKTAYRVKLPRGEGRSSEEFFKAAVRKLRDKTSWEGGDP